MQKWSKVGNPDIGNPHIWIHFTIKGPQIGHKNLQRYEIQNNKAPPKLLKHNSKKRSNQQTIRICMPTMQEIIYRKNVQVPRSDIKTYPLHKIGLRKSRIRNPHTIS
jgi:hypothetical protein